MQDLPPSLDLSQILKDILNDPEVNLTPYGAACLVGAETDENLKTIQDRIYRYLNETPKTWRTIIWLLDALGYEVQIKPKALSQADQK